MEKKINMNKLINKNLIILSIVLGGIFALTSFAQALPGR